MRIFPFLLAVVLISGAVRPVLPELTLMCGIDICAPEECVMLCESSCSGDSSDMDDREQSRSRPLPSEDQGNCCLAMVCCNCCCYFEQLEPFSLDPPVAITTNPGYQEGLIPHKHYCEVFHPPEFVFI